MHAGRDVVFLHGAGTRGAVWQLQALAFPQGRTPDLPGRDGQGIVHTVERYAAALGPVLTSARVLVGHSLGGAIALSHALASPGHLAGLVLLGVGARLDTARRWIDRLDHPGTVEELSTHLHASAATPRLAAKSLALLRSLDPAVLRADFAAAVEFDVRDRLGGILVPVLVIAGTEDRFVPPADAEFLHAHLPRASLTWLEGAGHMMMLEQPEGVNEAIRNFLERVTER